MKRKFLVRILSFICVVAGALALNACNLGDTGSNNSSNSNNQESSSPESNTPSHEHTFGEWVLYGNADNSPCPQRVFSRICDTCHSIEWKYGEHVFSMQTIAPTCTEKGYDKKTCTNCGTVEKENFTQIVEHNWQTAYTFDDSYHWKKCADCNATKDKTEHIMNEEDLCIVCDQSPPSTEGILYDISADGTYAALIGYEGTDTDIKIASTYKGLPVKTIYNQAFYQKYIVSVIIPDSVTSIGGYAFSGCSSLTSVTMGNSVTSIGDDAFAYCSNLTSIVIPDSVTSIGNDAFRNCSSLTSIVIPDSVTSIGTYAFSECSSLTSVTIPDSVTSIGYAAFEYCSSLTSIVIPDSVTYIGYYAFYRCSNLININVNENNTAYQSINGNLYTKDGKNLVQYAIGKTDTSFTIPDSVTSIGDYAFYGCSSLTSIVIPDSVTSIGNYAFYGCSSLPSIVIPDSVASIGNYAFRYCSRLTIYCEAESKPSGWDYDWNCDNRPVVWGYKGEE